MSISDQPLVSVVIPSYQSARHVRHCLRALEQQTTSVPYEVILADSSSDGTDRIVAAEFPWVKLRHFNERLSVGAGRNAGVEMARGDVVLFTDTDCVPCREWIARLYEAFAVHGADGAGGSMVNGTPRSPSGSAGFFLEFFKFIDAKGQMRPASFLVGGNSGYRRAMLRQHRYPSESLGEDVEYSWRASRQKGLKLLFVPQASVIHRNRTGWRQVLGYQRKIGAAAVAYRSVTSPQTMAVFRACPRLALLLPGVILPWIGASIAWRGRWPDLGRFLLYLPVCLAGNAVWALGFYRELRRRNRFGWEGR